MIKGSSTAMNVIRRNNVHYERGDGTTDAVQPRFRLRPEHVAVRRARVRGDYRIVLFDHVGAGGSDLSAYDQRKYASARWLRCDVLEICARAATVGCRLRRAFGERDDRRARRRTTSRAVSRRSSSLGPRRATSTTATTSAGFPARTSKGCWTRSTATISAGRARWRRSSWATPTARSLASELTNSFCRTDPDIAADFARVTFLSDNRQDLSAVTTPTLDPSMLR